MMKSEMFSPPPSFILVCRLAGKEKPSKTTIGMTLAFLTERK